MSFKSFHLANSRSLLVIMGKTPRGAGCSGLALLPPLKAWGLWSHLGLMGRGCITMQLSICCLEILSRPQSTLENTHAQGSWLCPHNGSHRSDVSPLGFQGAHFQTNKGGKRMCCCLAYKFPTMLTNFIGVLSFPQPQIGLPRWNYW